MENFFIDENFYEDLADYIEKTFGDDKEAIEDLDDNFEEDCREGVEQSIFPISITTEWIIDTIVEIYDRRFPEESDELYSKIKKLLEANIIVNTEAIEKALPKLFYPYGKRFTITKQDLLDSYD